MKRRAVLLFLAASLFPLAPREVLAVSGSHSFAQPSPALLTVYYPQSLSNPGVWTNWGPIPAGARVTNVMVLWNVRSTGGSGVHVALCNQVRACVPVGNGAWSGAFAGQNARQNWSVAFYVDRLQFPGQPFHVGVANLVVSYTY